MTADTERCDQCGGYIDSMNSDAICRYVIGAWRLWCDFACIQAWVAAQNAPHD